MRWGIREGREVTIKGEPGTWKIDRVGVELGTHRQIVRCVQPGRPPIYPPVADLADPPEDFPCSPV